MTVNVLLLRHARSTANSTGVLAGRSEGVHLDQAGWDQSLDLLERLRDVEIASVVGSPLLRCRQTVEALTSERRLEYVIDENLNECDYGDWTNRNLAECASDPLWAQIQNAPATVTFPGGESMTGMAQRVWAAVRAAVDTATDGTTLLIVSHGDPIKAVVAAAIGLPLNQFQSLIIDPASITLLRFTADRVFLVRLNDSTSAISGLINLAETAPVGGGAGGGGAGGGGQALPSGSEDETDLG